MTDQMYDIAIIGGGLAGLSLAIQAATEGHSVVLFEKEQYPFHKVCGEYISRESWDFLHTLGISPDDYHVPHIRELLVSDTAGKAYTFSLPLGGFGISRYLLDQLLCEIAMAKGATVLTASKVTDVAFHNHVFSITANGNTFKARLAAGCFGKRSNLDVQWQRPFTRQKPSAAHHYIGVKYHIRYPHPPGQIALHNFSHGYCGMSAIEEGKSCLCYLTTAGNLQRSGQQVAQMERNILSSNPLLQQIFDGAQFEYAAPLVISQVNFSRKQQVENHVLMLGDAAGLISPLCGNGMSMALHASLLAWQQMRLFLQHRITRQQLEDHYTAHWQQQFARRLSTGRKVQQLFGHHTTTRLFLQTMHALPVLARWLIRSTHGRPF